MFYVNMGPFPKTEHCLYLVSHVLRDLYDKKSDLPISHVLLHSITRGAADTRPGSPLSTHLARHLPMADRAPAVLSCLESTLPTKFPLWAVRDAARRLVAGRRAAEVQVVDLAGAAPPKDRLLPRFWLLGREGAESGRVRWEMSGFAIF